MLTLENAKKILAEFGITPLSIAPTGSGHINDTYLVITEDQKYILQRINTAIFTDPEKLMHNLVSVTGHLDSVFSQTREQIKKRLPNHTNHVN